MPILAEWDINYPNTNSLNIYSTEDSQVKHTITLLASVVAIAWVPNRTLLTAICPFSTFAAQLLFLDPTTADVTHKLPCSGINPYILAWAPSGRCLVYRKSENVLAVWNYVHGKEARTLTLDKDDHVIHVSWSYDSTRLILTMHNKFAVWAVNEWCERIHLKTDVQFRRLVFCIMCVKHRLETVPNRLYNLSIEVWLVVIRHLFALTH
jgi:WD40 repeat protein